MNSVTKFTFTILAICFLFSSSYGQETVPLQITPKGTSKFGISTRPTIQSGAFRHLELRFEQRVLNRVALGIQTNFNWNQSQVTFGTGFFGRYYILNRKISPFLEAKMQHRLGYYARNESSAAIVSFGKQLEFGGGISFDQLFKNKNFGFEVNFGFRSPAVFPNRLGKSIPYIGFGLTYRF